MLCVVKRNVQVMKRDVMSPDEVVELVYSLRISLAYRIIYSHNKEREEHTLLLNL